MSADCSQLYADAVLCFSLLLNFIFGNDIDIDPAYDVTGENVVHYNLPNEQQSAVENFLKVNQDPTYRLIDRNGNLLDVNADPRNLDALENLLKAL